jgi:hypothetical protein
MSLDGFRKAAAYQKERDEFIAQFENEPLNVDRCDALFPFACSRVWDGTRRRLANQIYGWPILLFDRSNADRVRMTGRRRPTVGGRAIASRDQYERR